MTRLRLLTLTLAVALLAGGCGGSSDLDPSGPSGTPNPTPFPPPPSGSAAAQIANSIIDLTNAERTQLGLGTLRHNSRLSEAARLQAEQIARVRRLDHVLPDAQYPTPEDRLAAAGYSWQAYGENLASGQRTAADAMRDWMNSPGHRANIANGNFTEMGAAFATDASARPYYVQVFGRPR